MYIGGKFFEIEMFSMNGNNWIREVINSKIWNSFPTVFFFIFMQGKKCGLKCFSLNSRVK